MKELPVFVAHASNIPDSWLARIDQACTQASGVRGGLRYFREDMIVDDQDQGVDQDHFFDLIKSANVFILLVNTEWTDTAEREYQLALETMVKRSDLKVHLIQKRYDKGEPEYETANAIYEKYLRIEWASQEEQDANGRYFRFRTEEELFNGVLVRLNQYTKKIAEDSIEEVERLMEQVDSYKAALKKSRKRASSALMIYSILIIAIVLLFYFPFAHQGYEPKRDDYLNSINTIERLIGEGSDASLSAAKDSIMSISKRYPPNIRDDEQIHELLNEVLSLQDSIRKKESHKAIPHKSSPKSSGIIREPMSVALSGIDGLSTDKIASMLKSDGVSFSSATRARWAVSVKENIERRDTNVTSNGVTYIVWIKYGVSVQDLSDEGSSSPYLSVPLRQHRFECSGSYDNATSIARDKCADDISAYIISQIKK